MMRFDYQGYARLLDMLENAGYAFADYHNHARYDRCVILRHDIDQSPAKAVSLARLEAERGVRSTWFVLLTSDFYNVASPSSQQALQCIQNLGHELGLHFDEAVYGDISSEECVANIVSESDILSRLLGRPVTTVSMHRPSKRTLEADLQIPGIINSYGHTFFRDFKYLSDSRRRWREPVDEIITGGGGYPKLQIVTHAFWYHDKEQSLRQTVSDFINSANDERYRQMLKNITDLESILQSK